MTPNDKQRLRLLAQLHYVAGGLALAIPLLGLAYVALGALLLLGKLPSVTPHPAHADAWSPIWLGLLFVLIGGAVAGANILAAGALLKRERRTLCLLTALLNCVHVPLGTALGVFTMVVLRRPTVRAAFDAQSAPAAGSVETPNPPQAGSAGSASVTGGG